MSQYSEPRKAEPRGAESREAEQQENRPSGADPSESDPLERLNRGLSQWERELLSEPRASARPRATDVGRFQDLLHASRSVTGTLDPNELLVRVVDAMIRIASADRGLRTYSGLANPRSSGPAGGVGP